MCQVGRHRQAAAILDSPRSLSEELLVQLHVFRERDPKRADVLHLMILMAHCVTDGAANSTFTRCLLVTLASGGGAEPAQIPLEDRLAMAIPSMDLEPTHTRSLSPAIRRWRRVVGIVIFQLRMAERQVGAVFLCLLALYTTSLSFNESTVICRVGIPFRVASRTRHCTLPRDLALSPPHSRTHKPLL